MLWFAAEGGRRIRLEAMLGASATTLILLDEGGAVALRSP
jgi:hypothetical protein